LVSNADGANDVQLSTVCDAYEDRGLNAEAVVAIAKSADVSSMMERD
jgi:hypothetical protein